MTENGKVMADAFDEHMRCEFVALDVPGTMRTMTANPHLTHLPTLMGGVGREEVADFYRDHFVGHWPKDMKAIPISRTIGDDQVIDELIVCFTHDIVMNTYLPGVAPTGKAVKLPHVVVVKFEGGKVAHEHIYWDQACLLVQVGLLDPKLLPVIGVEQAEKLLDMSQPMNRLLAARHG